MPSQDYLEKMQLRQSYRNLWHTDLMSTITASPPFCCLSLWCGPCVSYMLRKRALNNDLSRYACCAGYLPCSGKCGESRCPEFCLCTEVFLCFGTSVAGTRFLIQDEFNIQTTQCDNCIVGFMYCLQQVACIFSIVAMIVGIEEINEASRILNCMSEFVYWTVCACMQTQHKIEMDKRDGKFGPPSVMAVPPVQHMSRIDLPVPPPVGYSSQPEPGHPPASHQPGSYPPPGSNPHQAYGSYPPLGSDPPSYGAHLSPNSNTPSYGAYPSSDPNLPSYGVYPAPGSIPPSYGSHPPTDSIPPSYGSYQPPGSNLQSYGAYPPPDSNPSYGTYPPPNSNWPSYSVHPPPGYPPAGTK